VDVMISVCVGACMRACVYVRGAVSMLVRISCSCACFWCFLYVCVGLLLGVCSSCGLCLSHVLFKLVW